MRSFAPAARTIAEAIEERLFKLRAIARKHRVPVSELPKVHRRFLEDLSKLETGEEELAAARKEAARRRIGLRQGRRRA